MQLPGSLLRVTVASSNIINETLFCFVLFKNASLEWYSLLIHIFIPKLHPERGFALHKAARGQVSFQKPEPTGSRRALGVFTGARGGTACTGTELFSGVLGSTPSTVQGFAGTLLVSGKTRMPSEKAYLTRTAICHNTESLWQLTSIKKRSPLNQWGHYLGTWSLDTLDNNSLSFLKIRTSRPNDCNLLWK